MEDIIEMEGAVKKAQLKQLEQQANELVCVFRVAGSLTRPFRAALGLPKCRVYCEIEALAEPSGGDIKAVAVIEGEGDGRRWDFTFLTDAQSLKFGRLWAKLPSLCDSRLLTAGPGWRERKRCADRKRRK